MLMRVGKIYEYLNEVSPFELQEAWDNSGLLVGAKEDEVKKIYIAFDLDLENIKQIQKNSLVIVHHPLIFKGLKKINNDTYSTKILKYLIKNDIALIAMHTNIDKTHLNEYVALKVLDLPFEKTSDFLFTAKIDKNFDELINSIKSKLGLSKIKVTKNHERIHSVSLCTGSGMSLLDEVTSDLFLTGDIKYHDAMEAKARGISIADIGHYESEQWFAPLLNDIIKKYLKKNKIKAIILDSNNPFQYM